MTSSSPCWNGSATEGPLGSRDFEGAGDGTDMWNWKPAKMVLEALWDRGALAVAGRQSFQRRYDLAERVIPRAVLDAPVPEEDETLRTFALLAVRARGALTEPAIREHWRLKGGRARLHHHVLALVDEGLLREVDADDGGPPFYVDAEAELDGDPAPPVAPLPLRQPALGSPAARAALRLPPRDRGLQARARARVRLLRAPAARRRPHRRPRRPQGRPRRGRAARAALPPRAARARERHREARARGGSARPRARARGGASMRELPVEEARRIAVRAQGLDGSAQRRARAPCAASASSSSIRSPAVAPPQHLVLWSRLGACDDRPSSTGCSGRSGSSSSGAPSSTRARTCRS